MIKYHLIIIFSVSLIPFFGSGFAETYDINMPTGSSSPDAPYFWQNEKSGEATGDIEISLGDTIVWKNGDQAKHTITSGTLEDGPDGIFGGTEFLVPGEFYQFTFKEKGRYPYFCLIHPWMTGVVTVTGDYKLIPDVGKNIGDGLTVFHVDYQYSGTVSNALVDEDQKSITLQITPDLKSNDHDLLIFLPADLIEGPFVVLVDNEKDLTFDYIPDDDISTIEIKLTENSKEVTIVGTKIMPEFGTITLIILGIAISSIILIQKSKVKLTL